MYGVVLMLAVTTGGESADLGRRGGCCGGGLFAGGGLFGGGCRGGGLFGKHRGGYGCNGGCYGGGYGGGCYGSGYGYGGCYGGGYGGGCYGSGYGGCYGGGYGYGYGYGGCYGGGYGCYGSGMVVGGGCYGGGVIIHGGCTGGVIQGGVIMDKKEEKKDEGKGADKKDTDNTQVRAGSAPATVVVTLPKSADLSFNGQSVGTSTSTRRTFVSPPLVAGRAYSYDLKVDYQKDGRAVSVRKSVRVEAGKTVQVDLTNASTTSAVASR